jgi:AraC-type DNA-binding domain-containing proteins
MNYIVPEIQLHETNHNFPYRIITVQNAAKLNYWHAETELIMPIEKPMTVMVENVEYPLAAGDILLVPGGWLHRVVTGNTAHKVIQFDLSIFEVKHGELPYAQGIQRRLETSVLYSGGWADSDRREIAEIFEELGKEQEDINRSGDETAYVLKIGLLLYRLVNILYSNLPESGNLSEGTKKPYDKKLLLRLERVLDYVKSHYSEDISLSAAAEVANYSVNHFTKIWLKYMGVSFHEYLNHYRINQAMSWLRETSKSVTEISSQSGFGSYKTFGRLFKAETGMSALEYRKSG